MLKIRLHERKTQEASSDWSLQPNGQAVVGLNDLGEYDYFTDKVEEDPDTYEDQMDYAMRGFGQDYIQFPDGDEVPFAGFRDDNVIVVDDIDHKGNNGEKAIELMKKFATGKLARVGSRGVDENKPYVVCVDGNHYQTVIWQ